MFWDLFSPNATQVAHRSIEHMGRPESAFTQHAIAQGREDLFAYADPASSTASYVEKVRDIVNVAGLTPQQEQFIRICYGLEQPLNLSAGPFKGGTGLNIRHVGENARRLAKSKIDDGLRLASRVATELPVLNNTLGHSISIGEEVLQYAAVAYPRDCEKYRAVLQQVSQLSTAAGASDGGGRATEGAPEVVSPLRQGEATQRLSEMVGLTEVKETIEEIMAFVRVTCSEALERNDPPELGLAINFGFFGRPGTGKTEVASLLGALLRDAGYLSSGHVVRVQRQDLVASYIGQTAPKTQAILEKARNGVLFIDEAHKLASTSASDFGSEAVSAVMVEMNRRPISMVIVFATYEAEREAFFAIDPGLQRRVQHAINFVDYTRDELAQILIRMARKSGFFVSGEVARAVASGIYARRAEINYGNAGDIETALTKAKQRRCTRIERNNLPTGRSASGQLVKELLAEDFSP